MDCTYAVRFDKNTTVEGYESEKYLEMYQNAEGSTPQEKINSMRRAQDRANRERIKTNNNENIENIRKDGQLDKTKRLYFKSPEDDVEWLDSVGGLGTDESITARDWAYIRDNINQKISKNNVGKIVTLHSMEYVYVIEIISFSEYNVLYKMPNDDNLNEALAARRKRRK